MLLIPGVTFACQILLNPNPLNTTSGGASSTVALTNNTSTLHTYQLSVSSPNCGLSSSSFTLPAGTTTGAVITCGQGTYVAQLTATAASDNCVTNLAVTSSTIPTPPPSGGGSINWQNLSQISHPTLGGSVTLGSIIGTLLRYLFPLAGMILLLLLIFGGYKIMFSGGVPAKIEQGRDIITGALVGFVIIFVSYWVTQLIGTILGLSIFQSLFP
jgi:hypothetical protein